jgi:hypothetical protein
MSLPLRVWVACFSAAYATASTNFGVSRGDVVWLVIVVAPSPHSGTRVRQIAEQVVVVGSPL